jgi:hypothetical protein
MSIQENHAPTGIKPQDRLAWHRQLTRDSELSSVDIHVGVVISNHFHNGSGECFLSTHKLAAEARMHRATAVRAVAKLVKQGHLRVKAGGGRGWANTYAMVLTEPYPATDNCSTSATVYNPKGSTSATVSDPKLSLSDPLNCSAGATPTLKENSKKEEEGLSIEKQDNPKQAPATGGWRRGDNGRAVLIIDGEQWQAWLNYYRAIGNHDRVKLMLHVRDTSRSHEWEEAAPCPPSHITLVGKQAVGR